MRERCATEAPESRLTTSRSNVAERHRRYALSPSEREVRTGGHQNEEEGSTAKRRTGRKAWRGWSNRRGRTEPARENGRTQVGLFGELVVGLCQDDLRPGFPGSEASQRRRAGSPTATGQTTDVIEPERREDTSLLPESSVDAAENAEGELRKPKTSAKIAARTANIPLPLMKPIDESKRHTRPDCKQSSLNRISHAGALRSRQSLQISYHAILCLRPAMKYRVWQSEFCQNTARPKPESNDRPGEFARRGLVKITGRAAGRSRSQASGTIGGTAQPRITVRSGRAPSA